MNEEVINSIIAQIMKRMSKPTLLVVTVANGYQQEIVAQLKQWTGIHWHILANQQACAGLTECKQLGEEVSWNKENATQWLNSYEQVIFPFLDFATVAEVCNGLYLTPAGHLFQHALMKGIPVYAFDYQCNPGSELNQILGLSNNLMMTQRVQNQLTELTKLGAIIGSLADVKIAMSSAPNRAEELNSVEELNRSPLPLTYITLNELKSKGAKAYTLQDNLTDLAAEYLKEQQLLK